MVDSGAPGAAVAGHNADDDEPRLIAALRRGDEAAFSTMVDRYHPGLVRVAMLYVADRATAEEVAQETWLGVLQGLDRFEARSSLKTWIFRILANQAKKRGGREGRSVPFSAFAYPDATADDPAVDAERFFPLGHEDAGHWRSQLRDWREIPESVLLAEEACDQLRRAIDELTPTQQEVITLRDVQGWSADEVCNLLRISDTNQRVLLHRARSKVRRALESYLERA